MNFIANIKNILIAAVIALAVGFGIGFYVKSEFVKADQVAAVIEVRREDAVNIIAEQAIDTKVLDQESKNNENAARISDAIRKTKPVSIPTGGLHVPKQEVVCSTDPFLSVRLVRLLNNARTGSPVESAQRTDAEEQAASDVTVSDLADSDVEVARLYRELAGRHDELVDWVSEQVKQQAK